MPKLASDSPQALHVTPLQPRETDEKPKRGRPRKKPLPPLPAFEGMSDLERDWFESFRSQMEADFDDLTDLDRMLIVFAGLELINYLRVMQQQISSGQVISMARQHPGIQFRALLDSLSITRRARLKGSGEKEDPNIEKARNMLLDLSRT